MLRGEPQFSSGAVASDQAGCPTAKRATLVVVEAFKQSARNFGQWLLGALIAVVVLAVVIGGVALWFRVGNELDPGCPSGLQEADDGRCYP